MNADRSVRPARPADVPEMGAVQAAAWTRAYASVLPAQALAEITGETLAAQWTQAVTAPPSGRHHVLVALADDRVVGFAAAAPAQDPDLDPAQDAELLTLVVDPGAEREGHGSRLLQAVVDTLRGEGAHRAHSWTADADDALRAFLEGAGWAADGAIRTLDLEGDGAVVVTQLRLHTDLGNA